MSKKARILALGRTTLKAYIIVSALAFAGGVVAGALKVMGG